jgi:DNA-binding CsgD family transcriptional regulator
MEESVALTRGTGDQARLCHHLYFLGLGAIWTGDLTRAASAAQECLALAHEIGDLALAEAYQLLGYLGLEQGDIAQANSSFRAALPLCRALSNPQTVAECLEGLAGVAAREQRPAHAASLLGAADRLRGGAGIPVPPPRKTRIEQTLAHMHGALTDDAFARAWAAGAALTTDAAVAAALEPYPTSDSAPAAQVGANLSKREREVLRLLAEGRSDKEIAEALFISPRTVTTHVGNIFNKLGLSGRVEAAAFAIRHALI